MHTQHYREIIGKQRTDSRLASVDLIYKSRKFLKSKNSLSIYIPFPYILSILLISEIEREGQTGDRTISLLYDKNQKSEIGYAKVSDYRRRRQYSRFHWFEHSDALNDETFRRDRRETRSRKGKVEGRRGTMSHEREKERKRRRRRRIGQSCFRAACNSLHWQTNKRENRQEEMKRI